MEGRYEIVPAGGCELWARGRANDCIPASGRKAEKRAAGGGGGGDRLGEADDVEEGAGVGDNVMVVVLGARAADFKA